MGTNMRYEFPSTAWFAMQEREVIEGVARMDWPDDFRFTLVERFRGFDPLPNGMMQGFRVDIVGSKATFRRGVAPNETGDGIIDISFEALRELIHLSSRDPAHAAASDRLIKSGDLVRTGRLDLLRKLGEDVHHQVFSQTA